MSGGEPEWSGPKIYVSRAVEKTERSKIKSGARSGRSRSGHGALSEDHRNRNAERQNSPLRTAPMLCTGVIESVVRK